MSSDDTGEIIHPSHYVIQKLGRGRRKWKDLGKFARFFSPTLAFENKKMLEIAMPKDSFRVVRRVVHEWVIE